MSGDYIVDSDAHYLESLPELAEYIPDGNPFKERFKRSPGKMFPSAGYPDHYMYGRIQREEVGYLRGEMTPEDIPIAMDIIGADDIIVITQKMLSFARLGGDDERPELITNAYADYMLDKVVNPNEGIHALLVLPYQDPEKAVDLIDRCGGEAGFAGACMICGGPEPPFGNRKYDGIYQACQDAGLPLVFHAGGASLDYFYIKGYEKFISTHTLGFLWSNMSQLVSLVIQGVPEKFPDLKIVFQESGILYVASLMARLDAEYLKRASEVPILTKKPSEYMAEFYYGTQPLDEPKNISYFEAAIEEMGGASQLLYSSDYPHWDYDPPSSITKIPFLSDKEKKMILGENAKKVFRI
jgi:predicted TIM-barrel fold metal-dependent hydrolase